MPHAIVAGNMRLVTFFASLRDDSAEADALVAHKPLGTPIIVSVSPLGAA